MALRHWLQLALTEGIGPILLGRLVAAAGSAELACAANVRVLENVDGIGRAKASKLADALRRSALEVDVELARCAAMNVTLVSREDRLYPVLLKLIPDPPAVLYVKGTIEPRDLNAIAIVGSRKCSHYGREQAERFAALLAGSGMTVVSGGARGVDSAAHRGAIAHPAGRTIAVLGCGADVAYPPENASLFEQIAARGAVISEYPIGTPPLKENFPRRNRIVSGMSRGVLVVEADVQSGALITARQACDDHGRPVFALPGRVDNAMSAGPHLLIRDGANLVTRLEDILEGLDPLPDEASAPMATESFEIEEPADVELPFRPAVAPPAAAGASLSNLSERQRRILSGIGDDTADVDRIIVRSELPAEVVLQELTLLTLRGVVKRVDGQTYRKR